jgi:hypothetical protein
VPVSHLPAGHPPSRARVALFGAPMPLGLGNARPPTLPVRSHDAAMTCRASRAALGAAPGGRKVAQSGSISGVFRAPVHHRIRGGVRVRHIHRWSSVTCHRALLDPVPEPRGLTAGPAPPHSTLYDILAEHLRRRRPAADRCPGELATCEFSGGAMVVAGYAGSGGRVAVRPASAGAIGRRDPPDHRAIRPAGLERCAAESDPGRNHSAWEEPSLCPRPSTSSRHGHLTRKKLIDALTRIDGGMPR